MSNNEWQIFDSTAVAAGRYDKIEQVLELQFDSGKIYKYYDVPQSIWLALCRSESKGTFFRNQISERFRYELTTSTNDESTPDEDDIEFDDNGSDQSSNYSVGTSEQNPFKTPSIDCAHRLILGLHYRNSDDGAYRLIHEAHRLDDENCFRFELFIKNDLKLPDLYLMTPLEQQKYIKIYKDSCKGEKVMDFYLWHGDGTRKYLDYREENLPEELVYIPNTDYYRMPIDRILTYNGMLDDPSNMWTHTTSDWEWPLEAEDENFPEISRALRLIRANKSRNNNQSIEPEKLRLTSTFILGTQHPDSDLDELTRQDPNYKPPTQEQLAALQKALLEERRKKQDQYLGDQFFKPKSGCAGVILICILTVASLYFI
jgi:hypothetical protein